MVVACPGDQATARFRHLDTVITMVASIIQASDNRLVSIAQRLVPNINKLVICKDLPPYITIRYFLPKYFYALRL